MVGLLVFGLGVLLLVSTTIALAVVEARVWAEKLVTYRLRFPRELAPRQVSAWLAGVPAGRTGLFGTHPQFGIETIASLTGIEHRLVVPRGKADGLLAQLQTAMPGLRYELVNDEDEPSADCLLSRFVLRGRDAPLGEDRAEVAATALLSALQPLQRDERIVVRVLVGSGFVPGLGGSSSAEIFVLEQESSRAEGERLRARRRKQRSPLVHLDIRVAVEAKSLPRQRQLLSRLSAAFTVMDGPGAMVRPSSPRFGAGSSFDRWLPPLMRWGLLVNVDEAPGLLGLPVGSVEIPGVSLGVSRQLLLPPGRFSRGALVAESDHPGSSERAIRLGTKARLQHLHVIGPTGTGKSTLLARLILEDIDRGRAVVVIDPKRDLIETVLARVPEHRAGDVVLLDPTDTSRPVGLNVLGSRGGEAARELAAEFSLSIFRSLFSDSWGPRTDDIMRAGLLTLSSTRSPSGRAWTLLELPELLTDERFRASVLRSKGVPESVRGFWAWFGSLSEAQAATVIGPALNKLRAFTTRTPVRLMVGQSEGLDLVDVLVRRRILLVPLSSGELGRGVAELLGSLILARLWAAVRGRTSLPADRRPAAFLYLDEFQNVLRLPLDLEDMLATARGLGVGLTLAHQHLGQLPDGVRAAVMGTARNRIVFQAGRDDARVLAPALAPLGAEDLTNLDPYHLVLHGVDEGAVRSPVTGRALDLESATRSASELAARAAQVHGRLRSEVEAEIRDRVLPPGAKDVPLGRMRRGDGS